MLKEGSSVQSAKGQKESTVTSRLKQGRWRGLEWQWNAAPLSRSSLECGDTCGGIGRRRLLATEDGTVQETLALGRAG